MNHPKIIGFARIALLALLLTSPAVAADWTYEYFEDFSTGKAQYEAYSSSMFWTLDANPLPEPYLRYVEIGAVRGLLFMDYKYQPAELVYRFPAEQTHRAVTGFVDVEVSTVDYPCARPASGLPRGELAYSVSADGQSWSPTRFLYAGQHRISISSEEGRAYVRFSGERAVIDKIHVSLSSPGATIRVPANFRTIQQAIDAARDGDIIEVAPGTYSGSGNRDIDFRGKRITVRSAEGPHNTIIDPGSGHRGFYFHSGETRQSVLAGFTIRGGRVYGTNVPTDVSRWQPSPSHPIGGGIYLEFSSPTILNCVIEDCGAEVGGGIGSVGGRPAILHSTIRGCIAGGLGSPASGGRGAGIALIGQSDARIVNCTIQDNSGHRDSLGAGLYVLQSAVEVIGSTLSGNLAPGALGGGGLYGGGSGTDITLRNSVISRNQADAGAGILIERYANWTSPMISAGLPCRIEIINCTIAQNRLFGFGTGGIHSNGADITIRNSIVWHNDGTPLTILGDAGMSSVTYSSIQWGHPGQGNIDADPLFASLSAPDYRLQSVAGRYNPQTGTWVQDRDRSPCIDAGDPFDSTELEPGRNGGRINMGAYGGTAQAGKSGRILQVPTEHRTIQEGIRAAHDGDAVLVWPGVYREEIRFERKAITVQSADYPAVITAPNGYAASFYGAESSRSKLANFVITGCGLAGILCDGASPTLKNLTITRNGVGITVYGGANPQIINCIIWEEPGAAVVGPMATFDWQMRYSCSNKIDPDTRTGSIDADPLFADPDRGNFHLKSQYGRYEPQTGTWVYDNVTSPCIDAGDPSEFPGNEPMPHGSRINMGAYGGTPYASKSAGPVCP